MGPLIRSGAHRAPDVRRGRLPLRPSARLPAARPVLGNIGARVIALVSVAVVTFLVARTGGAQDVGLFALMRVLPGLAGVVAACGLPGAIGYFVAGPDRANGRMWPTIQLLMGAGGVAGAAAWLVLTPFIHTWLMDTTTVAVVALLGATVATQLPVAVGKACLQAMDDPRGANLATAAEEAACVPAFALAWAAGLRGGWLLVVALLVADVVVAVGAWARITKLARRGATPMIGRPDAGLARRMVVFGVRSQVGGIVTLLNLRLDVVVLGAIAGPAPVGVYVVASKFAEILRIPALALTWVVYPRIARDGAAEFLARFRGRMPGLLLCGLVTAALLAASAFPLLPLIYGAEFRDAGSLAAWIALGLVAGPAAGVAAAFLLGSGRPGLGSAIQAAGLVATLTLDLLLIPTHGALGAAWASAVAYLTTDVLLIVAMRHHARRRTP